ncbi:MAG: hypothetical protein KA109_14550 [Saprospiraceae bacterium]|nr:hypothetical protein [Saprospiraceae bacterium]MBK6480739.1 hypothetical protein [Saprospiraceae bacterium]MBK7371432.1 hypothetical protein [Saprospiraceae bacterium]MBK7436073.1 hypothetical protein [Saprospiraceae bacterium]MBK7608352.1 hypothetical protein [Saprospiraceae bacterium]
MRQSHMYRYPKDYKTLKAEFVRSVFNTIGTSALLIFINQATSPGHFWARIPVFIMFGVLVLKGFKLLGSKVAHRMEEKHFEPSSRQEYTAPYDHLELKNLSDYQQHQKPWKESEFVKSNLQ